jgi:4-amino-4-deoxy-L-arabinose transferase-like glycosyltransferase
MKFFSFPHSNIFFLILIILLAVILRYQSISEYKFYPDSYDNIIIAKNIEAYGSAAGNLGDQGMLYPPFLEWTRPMYPTLIVGLDKMFGSEEKAGSFISFILGILAIPLAYLLLKELSGSKITGIIAAFLLAISFNHNSWGGFILTETTGVFFMLLLLLGISKTIAKNTDFLNWKDLLTGVALAAAVLTRYEYAAITIPIILLSLHLSPNPWKYLLNILLSAFVVISGFLFWLSPWPYSLSSLTNILSNHIWFAIPAIIILGLVVYKRSFRKPVSLIFLVIFSALFLSAAISSLTNIPILEKNLSGLADFTKWDFVLSISFLFGLYNLYKRKSFEYVIFVCLSMLILGSNYYQVNPDMQRYWTHVIPFMLIPASYLIKNFLRFADENNRVLIVLPLLLFGGQLYVSEIGMRKWDDSIWFKPGYEEVSAKNVNKIVEKDSVIIASYPETYYLYTNVTTHSVTNTKPFVYLDNFPSNTTLFIVNDMGMKDYFPNFSQLLDNNLKSKKITEYFTHTEYRRGDMIKQEIEPVKVYKLTIKELQDSIASGTK